jgi:hypothetical protein
LVVFVTAPLIASCNDTTTPRWAPAEVVAGSWQWVRSVDVRTAGIHTPSSDGFQASLVLVAESARAGTYTYSRVGASPISGNFTIGSEDAPGNDFISIDQPIDFLTQHAWISSGLDSLRLNGVFELGFNSTYARIK